ncbi:MAG: hypothetical protein HOP02_15895, partial [Methylococcaceae bacterium]|nr:hypothetical protein [Methylococcaceae bacterium]
MDLLDVTIWIHWFSVISILLPRLLFGIIVWLVALRFKGFRRSIQQAESKWRYRLIMIVVFGLFAIYGTHSGIAIDVHQNWDLSGSVPKQLESS